MKINKQAFQQLLKEEKITRYELSDLLGIDRTYLWRLLRGYQVGMKVFDGFRAAFPEKDATEYFIMDDDDTEPINK